MDTGAVGRGNCHGQGTDLYYDRKGTNLSGTKNGNKGNNWKLIS